MIKFALYQLGYGRGGALWTICFFRAVPLGAAGRLVWDACKFVHEVSAQLSLNVARRRGRSFGCQHLMGTELIVGFGGRCWRCPLSRRGDVKGRMGWRRTLRCRSRCQNRGVLFLLYLDENSFCQTGYALCYLYVLILLKNQGEEMTMLLVVLWDHDSLFRLLSELLGSSLHNSI